MGYLLFKNFPSYFAYKLGAYHELTSYLRIRKALGNVTINPKQR